MSFTQKVVKQSHQVSKDDIDELYKHGLSDDEILDVILASTARSFISKTLDAIDTKLNIAEIELEPELIQLLSVGRPFP